MNVDRIARWVLTAAAVLSVAAGLLSGVLYAMEPNEGLLLRLGACGAVAFLVALLWWITSAARREGRAFSEGLLLLSSLCLLLAVATVGGLTVKQLFEASDTRSVQHPDG